MIASLNQYSEHPFASRSQFCESEKVTLLEGKILNPPEKVVGTVNGKKIALGNAKLMEQNNSKTSDDLTAKSSRAETGKSVFNILVM
jgi:Cu2+-exporting ATPase